MEGAADYYDDTVAFSLGADDEDGWWRATDISGQDIVNINPGNIIMASGTGGKVGIGTPTPLESLDVVGAIGVTGGPTVADSNHIIGTPWFNFGGAPQGAWVPGYVKLVTPIQQGEGNMFSIRITGYRYGSGGPPVEIRCGGYAYTGSGTLMQKGCHTEGIGDPVGIGTEGGYVVITIGSKDYSVWYFDHFTFEYSGWQKHEAKDFQWVWVSNQTPPFGNTNSVFINDSAGTVGIGTATPATKLDVQGEIKVGNSGAACDAATVGATRYDSVSDAMQYCAANGGGAVPPAPPVPAWVPYGGGGGFKNITVLQSPGTFTWSAPADTTAVMVELWGGGRGGGASGGGGYGKDTLNVVPGNSYSVVAGAGGAASAAGGTSSFATITATGGQGGGPNGGVYGGTSNAKISMQGGGSVGSGAVSWTGSGGQSPAGGAPCEGVAGKPPTQPGGGGGISLANFSCPADESVTGFDGSGQPICSGGSQLAGLCTVPSGPYAGRKGVTIETNVGKCCAIGDGRVYNPYFGVTDWNAHGVICPRI